MRYALDIRVRNAAIAEALRAHQCNQTHLAEMIGVPLSTFNGYATLRLMPYSSESGLLKPSAQKIATFLGLNAEEAFPPSLYEHFRDQPSRALVIQERNMLPLSAIRRLPAPAMDIDPFFEKNRTQAIEHSLQRLTPREEAVIRRRFGLDGEGARTLEEIAQADGLSRGRIQQIEKAAFRKLRQPAQSKRLRDFA
jgi:RNA polymerase sigma factor (sigma-70 family)